MTELEKRLIYRGEGNYKGWSCASVGCGLIMMVKNDKELRAYRGWEVKDWVAECWDELKNKIDKLES